MAQTQIDKAIELLMERLRTIQKDETNNLTGEVYDITVDEVFHTVTEYQNHRDNNPKARCKIHAYWKEAMMKGVFGRKRLEFYDIVLDIEFRLLESDQPIIYQQYFDHLFHWIYITLDDDSTTVNNLWDMLETKPSMMKMRWKLLNKRVNDSFSAQVILPKIQLGGNIGTIFVT